MGCINSKHGASVAAAASPAPAPVAQPDRPPSPYPSPSPSNRRSRCLELEKKDEKPSDRRKLRKKGSCGSFIVLPHRHVDAEQVAAGWPSWLTQCAAEVVCGWLPLSADAYEKLDKIGQGTYSNVFRARELATGRMVALKKVRFDNFQPRSVRFMAREIKILRSLHHPNVMKLDGVIASQYSSTIYLVFEYMEHDLSGLSSSPHINFTESQIKCYMKQLLCGLEHCHSRGVMHRDIKTSNILVNNQGILKLADFGLANILTSKNKQQLTSRLVTLWYRPPELLMGSTSYDITVDLWSVGCVFGELLTGKPVLKARTEVEQLHKIFKLCGSPPDDYWKKVKLPLATMFKSQNNYESCLHERFRGVSPSTMSLLETLLSIQPQKRGTASSAITSEYFRTQPYPCDPSNLPKYAPNKEIDAKYREELRRKRESAKMPNPGHSRKLSKSHGTLQESRDFRNLEAEAELQDTAQSTVRNSALAASTQRGREHHLGGRKHNKSFDTRSEVTLITQGVISGGLPVVAGSSSFAWTKTQKDTASTLSFNQPASRSQISAVDSTSVLFLSGNLNLIRQNKKDITEGVYVNSSEHAIAVS